MLKETITKNIAFVIFLMLGAAVFSACSPVISSQTKNDKSAEKKSARWSAPKIVGTITTAEITEGSGLAASRCQPNVFWTHNDSGDAAFVFALNETGEKLGTFKIEGAKNRDWEDIAAFKAASGECFLYIGDIGNNTRVRSELRIFRIKEPTVSGADENSSVKNPVKVRGVQTIIVDYPGLPRDAETLLVHPQTGDIYILTKQLFGAAGVYKLSKDYDSIKENRLTKIAELSVPATPGGFLTGGSIAGDGKHVVICDYFNAYELILPETARDFDEIWRQKPSVIELGKREQGEAVTYSADGEAIYATSEKRNSPLIKVEKSKAKE